MSVWVSNFQVLRGIEGFIRGWGFISDKFHFLKRGGLIERGALLDIGVY